MWALVYRRIYIAVILICIMCVVIFMRECVIWLVLHYICVV
jgi:hypothetical protein